MAIIYELHRKASLSAPTGPVPIQWRIITDCTTGAPMTFKSWQKCHQFATWFAANTKPTPQPDELSIVRRVTLPKKK